MRICTFLWSYFGYTTSIYEGQNVELMRNRNGGLMARADKEGGMPEVDYVAGVLIQGQPTLWDMPMNQIYLIQDRS